MRGFFINFVYLDLIRCFAPCFGEHTEHESSEQLLNELFDGDRLNLKNICLIRVILFNKI